jgi:hypothetical protein
MISPQLWEEIPFGDVHAWQAFLGDHARMHSLTYYQAVQQGKPKWNTYPLGDGGGVEWLCAHYQEHLAINSSYGLTPPPDLASYNLKDPEQFLDWMEAHGEEHVRINQAANIS